MNIILKHYLEHLKKCQKNELIEEIKNWDITKEILKIKMGNILNERNS